jgi:hypothetical protein
MRGKLGLIGTAALVLLGVLASMSGAGVPRVVVGEEFGATW